MNEYLDKILNKSFYISVVVVILALVVFFVIEKISKKIISKCDGISDPKASLTRKIAVTLKFLTVLLAIILISQTYGINLTSAIAGLGILSAVLGLALQDYLKDIIMGIRIVSDRFFSIGDCVEYQSREGVVVGFSLKATKIKDLQDSSVITVCNRNITEIRRLGDRLDIDLPLSYDEDLSFVNSALSEICKKVSNLKNVNKCGFLGTESFESSAVLYKIRVFCEPINRAEVKRSVLFEIQKGLSDKNIKIPFNQLTIHTNDKES